MRPDAEETLRLILARLDDMKAEDTITIDLTGKTSLGDYMVVTTGRSNRHVNAVADNTEVKSVVSVRIAQTEDTTARILSDPDRSWSERILAEQFSD